MPRRTASILPRSFYNRPAAVVARDLLGCILLSDCAGQAAAGRIVEVEAYIARDDTANHASRGKTRRNAVMFGPPGYAYVYLIYGAHYCLNAVTGPAGTPEAVLIRAIEPTRGAPAMAVRRAARGRELTNGPAKVCEAMGIRGQHNGLDLTVPPLRIARGPTPEEPIHQTTRVGCPNTPELPLRWYLAGNPFVSTP